MRASSLGKWENILFSIALLDIAFQSHAYTSINLQNGIYESFGTFHRTQKYDKRGVRSTHPLQFFSSISRSKVIFMSNTEQEELNLTPELAKMVEGFKLVSDEKARYKNLMYLANTLVPVGDDVRVPENKVPGCLSTVHVTCEASDDENGKKVVSFRGDSDGLFTKGLLALLIRGFSGCTPDEIEAVNPKFIQVAGISQTLTPGRNNGFLNMVDTMKRKSWEAVNPSDNTHIAEDENEVETNFVSEDADQNISSFVPRDGAPMYNAIMSSLITTLKPTSIELVDESSQHAGHAGSKGWEESGESHFSLSIVTEAFNGMTLVKRHQMIYLLLGDTMQKIHALQISAKTPQEVQTN